MMDFIIVATLMLQYAFAYWLNDQPFIERNRWLMAFILPPYILTYFAVKSIIGV